MKDYYTQQEYAYEEDLEIEEETWEEDHYGNENNEE